MTAAKKCGQPLLNKPTSAANASSWPPPGFLATPLSPPVVCHVGQLTECDLVGGIWEQVLNSKEHTGTTLEAHLQGVAALLEEWGQRQSVKLAGLYHAVYGNPGGRSAICSPDDPDLALEIGDEAEYLVRLWAVLDRSSLHREVRAFSAGAEPIVLASHTGELLAVSRQQFIDLTHIQVANSIEVATRGKPVNYNLQKLHPVLSTEASVHLNHYCPGTWDILMLKFRPRTRLQRLWTRFFYSRKP